MLDVPVPAAAVRRPRSRTAVRAHAFGRDCVCFHPDSFLSLNFNHAALESRATSRLNLKRWRAHLIARSKFTEAKWSACGRPALPANDWATSRGRGFAPRT